MAASRAPAGAAAPGPQDQARLGCGLPLGGLQCLRRWLAGSALRRGERRVTTKPSAAPRSPMERRRPDQRERFEAELRGLEAQAP
jgi:hypothetical protein